MDKKILRITLVSLLVIASPFIAVLAGLLIGVYGFIVFFLGCQLAANDIWHMRPKEDIKDNFKLVKKL